MYNLITNIIEFNKIMAVHINQDMFNIEPSSFMESDHDFDKSSPMSKFSKKPTLT